MEWREGLAWKNWRDMCGVKIEGWLGFRDAEEFSFLILAKQGWRSLINPDSLVARTLKAQYFPNVSFLEATKRTNFFYV